MFWKSASLGWFNQLSITNKLTFLYTILTSSILIFLVIAAFWIVQEVIITAEKQYIVDEAHVLQNLLKQHHGKLSFLAQEVNAVPEALTSAKYRYYIRIYNNNNLTLMKTPNMDKALPDPRYPALDIINWQNTAFHWESINGRKFLSMTAPIQLDNAGKSNLYMQMALDGTYSENIINGYIFQAILFLLIAIAIITILGRIITKKGLSRLYEMIEITERISLDKLTERINVDDWPKELIPLGKAFNDMLLRIDTTFQRISECTTELAHELRTPIHNLMLATEVLLSRQRDTEEYKAVLESNFEEYQRLSSIIDNVLFLARAENPKYNLNKTKINLASELNKIAEYYKIAAAEKNITISVVGKGEICVDLTLFQRAIGNLICNAIQHACCSGAIVIAISKVKDNKILITVQDSGVGISSEQLPYIFDRFYRIKSSTYQQSAGVGLGLAIVKSIMDLHDGKITVQSQFGKGVKFDLIFQPN